jgi:hypothetical protein
VLVRNSNDPTGSLLSRFGLAGDVAGAAAGGALGGVLKSSLETEVQLLQSRELAGILVDSLALQARVLAPHGVPATALFAPGRIGTSFRRVGGAFDRAGDGRFRANAGDSAVWLTPGRPSALPGVGVVTLRAGALPAAFRVQFEDREDAITGRPTTSRWRSWAATSSTAVQRPGLAYRVRRAERCDCRVPRPAQDGGPGPERASLRVHGGAGGLGRAAPGRRRG